MSISIIGDNDLLSYSNVIPKQVYMSTVYTLTGTPVFVQYKNPVVSTFDPNLAISHYVTNFGDTSAVVTTSPDETVFHTYTKKGTFFVSYTAFYNDPQESYYPYVVQNPFIVESQWNDYNQEQLRLNNEITLSLPYTLEEINIQPNEWGVEDIFNTSIIRLQETLNFLNSNIQTINIQSPTVYYGWLGNNSGSRASGIKWFTQTYNASNINNPELANNSGSTYFSDIRDACETSDHIYILDGTKFRAFSAGAIPVEREFINSANISNLLSDPLSFDINENGDTVYICDSPSNKVYKFNVDLSEDPTINIELSIGGFGSGLDNNKFNSPTQVLYNDSFIYVLDYNNLCIKQFNLDLNWTYTYTTDDLDLNRPISIDVHPKNQLLFVLTETYKILIYDNFSEELFETIDLSFIKDGTTTLEKIVFDENGDFFYILTNLYIFKFSTSGNFITQLSLPVASTFTYRNLKKSKNKSFIISMPYGIQKIQDVLQIFKLGNGLPSKYWSDDQLKVKTEEFTSDVNYNRSLTRIAQNIKSFRDTLNAKFVLASEQTKYGVITYFSWLPIDVSEDLPVLDIDVENETLGVGVNELHVPSVFNREFEKLYTSLESLKTFIEITNVSVNAGNNNNCAGQFCWSWNAMSSYNLTLPVIRTCNINPITYFELTTDFPANYAPTKTWAEATSKCCSV
jgi:hypothetical protein